MKDVIKIVLTNWINLIIIFALVFIASFLDAYLVERFSFDDALFGVTYGIVGYGLMFWLGFLVLVVFLDLIFFSVLKHKKHINNILVLQCLLISAPFIYWLIKYNQWIFMIAVLAFLFGQYLRRYFIFKILS